jgi:mannose-6-phosphate isomerase-like protein (cupin superfamily)
MTFLFVGEQRGFMEKINLAEKFGCFQEHWTPKIVAELNGQAVKLAKLKGEFIWHHHENEDELFLVAKGVLTIRFRDGDVTLKEGEMIVVPRRIEHLPVAEEEVWVLLFEPNTTLNTGNQLNERTVGNLGKI